MGAHGFAPRTTPLIFLAVPCVAAIAGDVVRVMDGSVGSFWVAALAVQMLTILGYAASSLAGWARWSDGNEARLTIVQGMAVSVLGGNIAYFGGYYYLPTLGYNTSEVGCFICAAVAGYGGDKFVSPLLSTITGFFSRIFPSTQRKGGQE